MEPSDTLQSSEHAIRLYVKIAAFAAVGLLVGAGIAFAVFSNTPALYQVSETALGQVGMPQSEPVGIRIPSVDIEAEFEEPLGLQSDGEIEVPDSFKTVGWYKYGPTPGELGPSVVLGHVDSKAGAEVFYNLRNMEVGDEIFIEREDGTVAVFEVTELEQHPQDDFPTEEVYGDLNYPGLRLITCSGVYDQGEARYTHNLIVYAKLKVENS